MITLWCWRDTHGDLWLAKKEPGKGDVAEDGVPGDGVEALPIPLDSLVGEALAAELLPTLRRPGAVRISAKPAARRRGEMRPEDVWT